MIIGISGKMGSGKDTVGKIIQIITDNPHFNNDAIINFLSRDILGSKFDVKKFADSLKDMVCIMISCTRTQLEDPVFKETELGEEWWYYYTHYEGNTPMNLRSYDGSIKKNEHIMNITPRLLLQLLGTECGRQIIHPNIWVNALMSKYKPKLNLNRLDKINLLIKEKTIAKNWDEISDEELDNTIKNYHYKKSNWIITDVRFPNELEAIKKKYGITIRVKRDSCTCDNKQAAYCEKKCRLDKNYIEHESETALDSATFDYIIDNSGTIEDLIAEVKLILISEQIT